MITTTTTPDPIGADHRGPARDRAPAAAAPEVFVCTRVITERTRTYTDGRTTVDSFYALYAPKEGIVCPR